MSPSPSPKARYMIFVWCTALTALGSIAASMMELLVFLGIGWDYASFNCLLILTLLSTIGLVVGATGLLAHRGCARTVILLSCVYIPVAFTVLTVRDFTPPAGWWLLLPLGLTNIVLCCLGPRSASSSECRLSAQ